MLARHAEYGTDARELDRCLQEGFAQAAAISGEIARLAIRADIAHGLIGLALIDEARGEDGAVTDALAIGALQLFIGHCKAVTGAQVHDEVDVPGKQFGQCQGGLVTDVGSTGCFK